MRTFFRTLAASSGILLPFIAVAQINTGTAETNITGFLGTLGTIIDAIVPFLIALAVLFFLYGLVRFMFAAGNEDAAAQGKSIMIWGIVILFVMVSVWGLVGILNQFTGVNTGQTAPTSPDTPSSSGTGGGLTVPA